mgnify:CR=1 FL=1
MYWKQAKKEAVKAQLERIKSMSAEELVSESMKRVEADTEKLTRRTDFFSAGFAAAGFFAADFLVPVFFPLELDAVLPA